MDLKGATAKVLIAAVLVLVAFAPVSALAVLNQRQVTTATGTAGSGALRVANTGITTCTLIPMGFADLPFIRNAPAPIPVESTSSVPATGSGVTTPTPSVHKRKCGKTKWKGSHKQWDKIARATLKKCGLTKKERRLAMAIHHAEGGPNSVSKAKTAKLRCYGGWQLSWGMAHGHRWWCPVWSSKRAVRYMVGRYGSIAQAYYFKRANGWY